MRVLYATDGSEAAFAFRSLLTKLCRRDQSARHSRAALIGRFYLDHEFDHEEVE